MKFKDLNLLDFGNEIQFVGALYQGNGEFFALLFPEEDGPENCLIHDVEMTSDEWVEFLQQVDFGNIEGEELDANGKIRKAVFRKSQRQIDQVVQWNVFRRDDYACRYCGSLITPLTVDHVICWEVGGPSTEQNLVTSCKKCNRIRGNLPYEKWLEHPYYKDALNTRDRWAELENKALLAELPKIKKIPRRSR